MRSTSDTICIVWQLGQVASGNFQSGQAKLDGKKKKAITAMWLFIRNDQVLRVESKRQSDIDFSRPSS